MVKVSGRPSPTRRLTILYICALSSVAIIAIMGQLIIQFSLAQQSSDANVINIAGRQRMLSQRLSKAALVLAMTTDQAQRAASRKELLQVVTLWEHSHQSLQKGDANLGLPGKNSQQVTGLFDSIKTDFDAMRNAAKGLLTTLDSNPQAKDLQAKLTPFVQTILAHDTIFLVGMDKIVSQYQVEAEGRVFMLKVIELSLLAITLIVLLLEGSFIFRPTTQRLNKTIADIVALEQSITKQKQELESGIEQLLQTHVQAANGDFAARAPLTRDHVLWQIAYSLNNLLLRIQRLSRAESELMHMRVDAARVVGNLQSQASQIRNELLLIQTETGILLTALRDAKTKDVPVWVPSSHTVLAPLCKELAGNYIQPALPTGRSRN